MIQGTMRFLSLMICAASLHAGVLTIVNFVPPVATEGIVFANGLADFTDSDPTDTCSTCTSTISWGDGTTSVVSIFPASIFNPTSLFQLLVNHTYAEEGSYLVQLTVDEGPANAAATATATVSDAPLTGTAAAPVAFTTNVALTNLLMTFTDANPNALVSDFSATVNWGDGTTSAGIVSLGNGKIFDVNGTHTYAQGGAFTVVVTANDIGGSTASVSTTAVGSAIPEPGTIGMVCVGLALAALKRTRRM